MWACQIQRETLLVDSAAFLWLQFELYVLTRSHHSWQGTWEDWGQRLCELQAQKKRTACLCSVFSKCSPSCRINIPKFSSATATPSLPPSYSHVWNQSSISVLVVEDKTQICVGSLWCLVSFLLNCIGADTSLMSAPASYLNSSAAFLRLPEREEMGTATLLHFIISDHDTACLSHTLFTTLPTSAKLCVCVWIHWHCDKGGKEKGSGKSKNREYSAKCLRCTCHQMQ